MPEENKGTVTPEVTTPPAGTDPEKKTDTGAEGAGVDTSKFTDADWDKVYKDPKLYQHSRFKSLNERATQAKVLEDEKKSAEEKRLLEEKKFQELAENKGKEADEWRTKAENATINNAIALAATKAGAVDIEAVIKLINKSGIKIAEDGVTVEGVDEAVKALVEEKKYLIGKGGNPNLKIGEGTNPSNSDTTTPRFKLSQLKDHKFFMAHEKEIAEALKLGLVINDTNQVVQTS